MKNQLKQKCYVNFSGKNNFTEDHNAGKVEFSSLPNGTYFLAGYQDENDKGRAVLHCFDGGTCLNPIYDLHGHEIRLPEYAGKELRNGTLQNA